MKTIFLISPYWKEEHRWMVSSYKLAELWQRAGYRVVVACLGSETKVDTVSDTLTVYHQKDFFLKDPWNYGISFKFFALVFKILRNEKPDVIVANKVLFWTSIAVPLLKFCGKKVILITDALVGMTWWPRNTLPKVCAALYAWTLGWIILLSAKQIVFFHPQPESLLSRLCIKNKSHVIPTGIDASKYQKTDRTSRDVLTVTYVGRLESVKGVDDYLAATTSLLTRYPNLHIQVVGFYKEGHPLVEEYKDRVTFTGLVSDVSHVLSQTDIFVLPSLSEGLSNALMEAMASGCSCIASEVGGNKYLIEDGTSGLLFPARDRTLLTECIETLVKDNVLRELCSVEARKRIEEVFDWSRVGKMYSDLFTAHS